MIEDEDFHVDGIGRFPTDDLHPPPSVRPLNAAEFVERVCGIDPNAVVGALKEWSDKAGPREAELLLAARALIAMAYQPAKARRRESPRLHRARARLANSIGSASAPDAVEELVRSILEAELNDNGER